MLHCQCVVVRSCSLSRCYHGQRLTRPFSALQLSPPLPSRHLRISALKFAVKLRHRPDEKPPILGGRAKDGGAGERVALG